MSPNFQTNEWGCFSSGFLTSSPHEHFPEIEQPYKAFLTVDDINDLTPDERRLVVCPVGGFQVCTAGGFTPAPTPELPVTGNPLGECR